MGIISLSLILLVAIALRDLHFPLPFLQGCEEGLSPYGPDPLSMSAFHTDHDYTFSRVHIVDKSHIDIEQVSVPTVSNVKSGIMYTNSRHVGTSAFVCAMHEILPKLYYLYVIYP